MLTVIGLIILMALYLLGIVYILCVECDLPFQRREDGKRIDATSQRSI